MEIETFQRVLVIGGFQVTPQQTGLIMDLYSLANEKGKDVTIAEIDTIVDKVVNATNTTQDG